MPRGWTGRWSGHPDRDRRPNRSGGNRAVSAWRHLARTRSDRHARAHQPGDPRHPVVSPAHDHAHCMRSRNAVTCAIWCRPCQE